MTPVLLFVLFIANMIALAVTLSVLFLAVSQNPGNKTGRAVIQFLGALAFYNLTVMLALAIQFVHGPHSFMDMMANLSIIGFSLCVITAFSLVVTLAGMMKQIFPIISRAGLLIFVLLQWPLWTNQFFLNNISSQSLAHYLTIGTIAAVVAFIYMIMTVVVAYLYRRSIEPLILLGITILMFGELLALFNPALREVGFASLTSVIASLILGYQLSQMRLFNPLRMQKAQLDALRDVSRSLIASHDFHELLHIITIEARRILNVDMSVIILKSDQNDRELVISAQDGGLTNLVGRTLLVGEGLNGRVFMNRQSLRLQNYHLWEGINSKFADIPIHAALSIPLIYEDTVVGVLNVSELKQGRLFGERDQAMLEMLAPQAALAIANAHLRQRIAVLEGSSTLST